jgi:DNA-binding HxlR family transcriptional regulator
MLSNTESHDPCIFLSLMEVVGGKWRGTIIYCLSEGPLRFNTLRDALAPISQKVLSHELKSLERDGLVARVQYLEVPPRVEYALTELGTSLVEIFNHVYAWRSNMKYVVESRIDFDK